MRYGTNALGAMETAMVVLRYAQIGRFLGLPTHGYLGLSDAKALDAQAGLESGIGHDHGGSGRGQHGFRRGHARVRELPVPGETGGR